VIGFMSDSKALLRDVRKMVTKARQALPAQTKP